MSDVLAKARALVERWSKTTFSSRHYGAHQSMCELQLLLLGTEPKGEGSPPEPPHDPDCRVCAGQRLLRDAGKARLARRGEKP